MTTKEIITAHFRRRYTPDEIANFLRIMIEVRELEAAELARVDAVCAAYDERAKEWAW
ncbi:hypothetical protein HFO91_30505 [Rhizobium leguminosarum]|uniref:hypothetical protein n=1 Tax=Rhizobium leguminosarum TaxID=384 RepID=UPI001C985B87|nr:hypothetical protein [Rhizobium leguminosarum]MBY5453912.1 hypothetical protein [Rhizobium leguminosarum]